MSNLPTPDLTKRFHFVSKGVVLHTTDDPEEAKKLVSDYAHARSAAMQEAAHFVDHPNPRIVDRGVKHAAAPVLSPVIKHAIHASHTPVAQPVVQQEPVTHLHKSTTPVAPVVTELVQAQPSAPAAPVQTPAAPVAPATDT